MDVLVLHRYLQTLQGLNFQPSLQGFINYKANKNFYIGTKSHQTSSKC